VLLFTTDAVQRFTADHSLAVHAVKVRVADAEDAFCASLRRALGSNSSSTQEHEKQSSSTRSTKQS
jgi:undecaprenyl pyrophosphate synthase